MMTTHTLRRLLGVGFLAGIALTTQADDTVTFQVDLSRYTNSAGAQAATVVDVRGEFDWSGAWTLHNNGANVYTNTFVVTGNPGDKRQYKFTYTTPGGVTWEDNNPPPGAGQPPDEGNNRVLLLSGGTQTLPVVEFYAPSVTPPIDIVSYPVTFQVDMNRFTNTLGGQAADFVDVRGAFNSWSGGWTLNNNGANVYTNTFNVVGSPNANLQYKFTFTSCSGTTWEDDNPPPGAGQPPDAGNNRVLLLNAAQTLPVVPFFAPSVNVPIALGGGTVTFRVDLTQQILLGNFIPDSGFDTNTVTGAPAVLTSWGVGVGLTNDPSLTGDASNIYSAVVTYPCGSIGGWAGEYKFRMNGGWEDCSLDGPNFTGQNRNFIFTGGNQVLPIVPYDDQPIGPLTNGNITFQVDMTPQVITGWFTNGVSTVGVAGFINGWSLSLMTNDPSLSGNASNLYSTTLPLPDGTKSTLGNWSRFKFRASPKGDGTDTDWETAAVYGVGGNKDRIFYIAGGDQTLPVRTYNDASLCDLLTQPIQVKVVLQITNGTPDINSVPFDKANDLIYLNGAFIAWNAANAYWTTNNDALPLMTNNPVGSDFYEQTIVLPAGSNRRQEFKFGLFGPAHGFTGFDNEGGVGANHVAYVRSAGSTYTFPAAQFGPLFTASLVEQQWGNLAVGPASGGSLPITWLGYPCVTLQSSAGLAPAAWVNHPATDAQSATNWPVAGGQQYFRLQKRASP